MIKNNGYVVITSKLTGKIFATTKYCAASLDCNVKKKSPITLNLDSKMPISASFPGAVPLENCAQLLFGAKSHAPPFFSLLLFQK